MKDKQETQELEVVPLKTVLGELEILKQKLFLETIVLGEAKDEGKK